MLARGFTTAAGSVFAVAGRGPGRERKKEFPPLGVSFSGLVFRSLCLLGNADGSWKKCREVYFGSAVSRLPRARPCRCCRGSMFLGRPLPGFASGWDLRARPGQETPAEASAKAITSCKILRGNLPSPSLSFPPVPASCAGTGSCTRAWITSPFRLLQTPPQYFRPSGAGVQPGHLRVRSQVLEPLLT